MIGLAAMLLAAVPAIADPSAVQQKRAQEQSVLARINRMNDTLGRAVESYNLANVKLQKIQGDLAENARELKTARSNLKIGEKRIAQRVVELYTSSGGDGTMEVILGAQSLDDLLNRLETADRVATLDTQVVKQVRKFRAAATRHEKLLRAARAAQRRVVGERAAKKRSIESQLATLHRLESSIQSELARLRAQERARQIALERQARARIAAAQLAQRARDANPITGAATDSGGTPLPSSVPDSVPAPPPSQYGGVVGVAMSQLGKPYVWGAAGPDAFDCSGLVTWAFAQLGVSVPHSSYALAGMGAPVPRDQLQPGDLVFFDGNGHVGIYIGGGQFVHAPHTGDVVKISSLDAGSYAGSYDGARRL